MSMSFPSSRTNQELKEHDEEESNQNLYQHYQELVSAIPSVEACSSVRLHLHDGWYSTIPVFVSSMVAQRLFQARQDDILLATLPKSGTTWLKALLFATANRGKYTNSSHPLATLNPHECVPFLENQLYMNNQIPDLDSVPPPRLFATHTPFHSLPKSVVNSGCRMVYLCRDPKDNFVSLWHFVNKIRASDGAEHLPLGAAFDRFCNGISAFGPYWDHVLGYWNAALRSECAGKILFVRYEEFMEEPVSELKRLAEFIGRPLTLEEEEAGVADGILELCGFDNLSNLQVNKAGSTKMVYGVLENRILFRRGAATVLKGGRLGGA